MAGKKDLQVMALLRKSSGFRACVKNMPVGYIGQFEWCVINITYQTVGLNRYGLKCQNVSFFSPLAKFKRFSSLWSCNGILKGPAHLPQNPLSPKTIQ